MTVLDINQIRAILPHRYPMLLVDRIVEMEAERVVGIKNVTHNEAFFQGHFPDFPVMPGVLIVEAMAQAAAILSFRTMGIKPDDKSVYYFAGIDRARFKKPVMPGDQLVLEVSIERTVRNVVKYAGKAYVGETLVAEAELLCTLRPID